MQSFTCVSLQFEFPSEDKTSGFDSVVSMLPLFMVLKSEPSLPVRINLITF